jgi:hypothetical protein
VFRGRGDPSASPAAPSPAGPSLNSPDTKAPEAPTPGSRTGGFDGNSPASRSPSSPTGPGNMCDTGLGVLVSPSCPTPAPVPGSCAPGYSGTPPACTPVCGGNCNGHGFCSGDGTSIPSCSCFDGFTGQLCEQPVCPGTPYCSGSLHGTCVSSSGTAICQCTASWTGAACERRMWALAS